MNRADLDDLVVSAIKHNGGKATILQICKYIWEQHESALRSAGNLFYTWQYDVRWSGNRLRHRGILAKVDNSPRGVWELAS